MAAVTPSSDRAASKSGQTLRYYGTGAANQADTMTSTAVAEHKSYKIAFVSCVYSAAPTQAGVTVTLDSGLGSGYDALLTTGSANALATVYVPDGDVILFPGDAVLVTSPAGGVGLTAAMTIVLEAMV